MFTRNPEKPAGAQAPDGDERLRHRSRRRVRRRHLRLHRHPEQQLHRHCSGRPRRTSRSARRRPPPRRPAGSPAPTPAPCRPTIVDELERLPGVDRVDGNVNDQGTYIIGKDGKVVGSGGGAPGIGGNFNDAPAADGSPIVTITQGAAPSGPGQLVHRRQVRGHQRLPARRHRPAGHRGRAADGDRHPGRHGAVRRLRQSHRRDPGAVRHPDRAEAVPGRCGRLQRRRGDRRRHRCRNDALRDEVDRGAAGRVRGAGRRADRRREPGPAAAGTVVHHHVPAGVRRGRAGRRHLPDPEHLLDHRRPADQGARAVPGARRLQGAGHPVGAARGAGGRPGRRPPSAWPGLRARGRAEGAVRRDRPRPRRRPAWSSSRGPRSPPTRSACW